VYLEVIANTSKSINFTIGVYPLTCKQNDDGNKTYLTMRIINSGTDDLSWTKANRVLVVLKDNILAFNYNTVAENGIYSCNYTLNPSSGVHEQTLCFNNVFSASDIANIYLSKGGEIYKLVYYKSGN
jgi:hypothetical protein